METLQWDRRLQSSERYTSLSAGDGEDRTQRLLSLDADDTTDLQRGVCLSRWSAGRWSFGAES